MDKAIADPHGPMLADSRALQLVHVLEPSERTS